MFSANALALSGSDFQAGNIIDNSLFFNSSAMSVDQIQNFMNAKVPVCDTNGTQMYSSTQTRAQFSASQGYSPPFTCLKDYSQNTSSVAGQAGLCNDYTGGQKTSAQIIYDVAQACGISPKVLLVLLQKEQSLVTDTWPWSIQYQKATGYACPDTAACDSQYYGFFNQVYNAAQAFRRYQLNPGSYNYRAGRNNSILYSPRSGCGSSSVYIQNQATAGLYVYTPYQPNPAALGDITGSGDVCSSYGNLNFWRLYNSWFGQSWGALIRTPDSTALYYSDGARKYSVPSMDLVAQYGLSARDVRYVSQGELDSIPLASAPYSNALGQVVKTPDDNDADGAALYLVNNASRIPITSMQQFSDFGFQSSDITYLSWDALQTLSLSTSSLSNFIQAPDMSVAQVSNGQLHAIMELSKLSAANPSGNITPLTTYTLSRFSYGTPLVDGDYIIIGPDSGLRLYRGGSYYVIPSFDVYNCWGLGSTKTFRVPSYTISNGSSSGDLNCIGKDSSNNLFVMNGSAKYVIHGSGLTTSSPSDSLISAIPTGTTPTLIKGSSPEVSVLDNSTGTKRPLPSLAMLLDLGYSPSSITSLPDGAYNFLLRGAVELSNGSVLIEPQGGISVVTSPTTRLQVTSIKQFVDFGFMYKFALHATSTELSQYASTGNLSNYVRTNDGVYLLDSGVRYSIDPSLNSNLGIDPSTYPVLDSHIINATSQTAMTAFIKSTTNSAVYELQGGQKHPLASMTTFARETNNHPEYLLRLSPEMVNSFPIGSTIF